jgi:hypothetical protein
LLLYSRQATLSVLVGALPAHCQQNLAFTNLFESRTHGNVAPHVDEQILLAYSLTELDNRSVHLLHSSSPNGKMEKWKRRSADEVLV